MLDCVLRLMPCLVEAGQGILQLACCGRWTQVGDHCQVGDIALLDQDPGMRFRKTVDPASGRATYHQAGWTDILEEDALLGRGFIIIYH